MSGYSNFVQGNGNVLPDANNPGCVNQEANKEDFVLLQKDLLIVIKLQLILILLSLWVLVNMLLIICMVVVVN